MERVSYKPNTMSTDREQAPIRFMTLRELRRERTGEPAPPRRAPRLMLRTVRA